MTRNQLKYVGDKFVQIRVRLVSLFRKTIYDMPEEIESIDQMLEVLYNTIKAMELPETVETESGDE